MAYCENTRNLFSFNTKLYIYGKVVVNIISKIMLYFCLHPIQKRKLIKLNY